MLFTDPLHTFRRSRRLDVPALRRTAGALLALSVLAAGGCADVRLPEIVFDDGPAPGKAPPASLATADAVLTGQRPVRRADPGEVEVPSLSSVPPRPTAFSTPVERQALLDRLQGERREAQAAADALRAPAPTGPDKDPGAPAGTPEPVLPDGPPALPEPLTR